MSNNLVFHSDPKKSHGIPKAEKAFDRWIEEKQKHLYTKNLSLRLAFVAVKDCKDVEMLLVLAMTRTELGIEVYHFNWLGSSSNYKSLSNWKKAIEGQMSFNSYNIGTKPVKFDKKDKEFVSFFKTIILEIELPLCILSDFRHSKECGEFNKFLSGMLLPNSF